MFTWRFDWVAVLTAFQWASQGKERGWTAGLLLNIPCPAPNPDGDLTNSSFYHIIKNSNSNMMMLTIYFGLTFGSRITILSVKSRPHCPNCAWFSSLVFLRLLNSTVLAILPGQSSVLPPENFHAYCCPLISPFLPSIIHDWTLNPGYLHHTKAYFCVTVFFLQTDY